MTFLGFWEFPYITPTTYDHEIVRNVLVILNVIQVFNKNKTCNQIHRYMLKVYWAIDTIIRNEK